MFPFFRELIAAVSAVLAAYPSLSAALHLRGAIGGGGDAYLRIVTNGDAAALEQVCLRLY